MSCRIVNDPAHALFFELIGCYIELGLADYAHVIYARLIASSH